MPRQRHCHYYHCCRVVCSRHCHCFDAAMPHRAAITRLRRCRHYAIDTSGLAAPRITISAAATPLVIRHTPYARYIITPPLILLPLRCHLSRRWLPLPHYDTATTLRRCLRYMMPYDIDEADNMPHYISPPPRQRRYATIIATLIRYTLLMSLLERRLHTPLEGITLH